MNTYTVQDWHQDRDFKSQPGQKVEASIYWDMLCGVPPIYSNRDTFQVGEAHSHDHEGKPLYGTFVRQGDDYYFPVTSVATPRPSPRQRESIYHRQGRQHRRQSEEKGKLGF